MAKIFLKKDTEEKIKKTVKILKKTCHFKEITSLYLFIDNEMKRMNSNKDFNNDIKGLCDFILKDIKNN